MEAHVLYSALRAAGLEYGPAFRTMSAVWASRDAGVAFGAMRKRTLRGGTQVHPADLDGAISPRHIAARGDDVVVALPNGDVYGSTDAGSSWSLVAA